MSSRRRRIRRQLRRAAKGGLTRAATMEGWFVMWTLDGSRLVHATSGPFRTKKEAQSHARYWSKVVRTAAQDQSVGTYYLWKNEGGEE